MKYYSEITKKLYDDEEALFEEEVAFAEAAERAEEEKKLAEQKVSARKKELSKCIEDADDALDLAHQMLAEAKVKCKEILDTANKEVSEVMNGATKAVKEAEIVRIKAVEEFNKEFGPFKVSYTGDRARREMERAFDTTDTFQRLIESIFSF